MLLIYTGPHAEAEILLPTGSWVACAHGGTIAVPDELGLRLLEQVDNWQRAPVAAPVSRRGKDE